MWPNTCSGWPLRSSGLATALQKLKRQETVGWKLFKVGGWLCWKYKQVETVTEHQGEVRLTICGLIHKRSCFEVFLLGVELGYRDLQGCWVIHSGSQSMFQFLQKGVGWSWGSGQWSSSTTIWINHFFSHMACWNWKSFTTNSPGLTNSSAICT